MNDEQEFIHAIELSKEILNKSRKNEKVKYGDLGQYHSFIDRIMASLDRLDDYQSDEIFTCSFSERTDLLSQWRGYCDESHGYCIHFDLDYLLKTVRESFPDSHIYSCIYDDAEKKGTIIRDLNFHWKRFVRLSTEKAREKEVSELSKKISIHASYFKHDSFSEEKEHRLVIRKSWLMGANIKFRTGPMSIVPYLEIPAPKESIRVVGIGPTRDQKLARRGVLALIQLTFDNFQFLTDVDIVESAIPYRS